MNVYMIGIKGAGMAGLAKVLQDDGYNIIGCDIDKKTIYDSELNDRNIKVLSLNDKSYLNYDIDFIVIGHSFISEKLKKELDSKRKIWFEYNDFLSFYVDNKKLVSICGSHGKTTMTHILEYLVTNSSYLSGEGNGRKVKNDNYFFLESCEYKDHFLVYSPMQIIVSNIDYDHVDYFKSVEQYEKSFNEFVKRAKGSVFININDLNKINCKDAITYGLSNRAHFYPKIIKKDDNIEFILYQFEREFSSFVIPNYGIHFLEEFVGCLAFMITNNISIADVNDKMHMFKPCKQRFNQMEVNGYHVVIDYAHHYSQIDNNYQIVSEKYKKYKKIAIFRPDRYSRIEGFKDQFIKVLSKYDQAYVLPLPNNSENDGKSSDIICDENIHFINKFEDICKYFDKEKCVICFMSSKPFFEEIKSLRA